MGDVPAPSQDTIRTQYAEDKELKASVIPSGRTAQQGGGSYAFDANNPDIPQNIIVCEGGEMRKIAQVTRAQLAGKSNPASIGGTSTPTSGPPDPTEVERRAEQTEAFYQDLDASKNQSDAVTSVPLVSSAKGLPVQSMASEPVFVTIKGAFGKIRQPFSKVFRDGMCLVLKADHATLPTSYELPDLEDEEVMQLELKIGDRVVQCIHAGIRFTEDSPSATFTVLLIQEETDIEEGRLR